MMLSTPAGRPASSASSPARSADRGVCSAVYAATYQVSAAAVVVSSIYPSQGPCTRIIPTRMLMTLEYGISVNVCFETLADTPQRQGHAHLDDDGVAACQRWAHLPGPHEQREIPGDDGANHAQRLMEGVPIGNVKVLDQRSV